MNGNIQKQMQEDIKNFMLPAYHEIPNVGLFLEQITKYINDYMSPLGLPALTGSMISNYVKKRMIPNPVKKQYGRAQIAEIFFIAVMKNVLSLDDVQLVLKLAEKDNGIENAYPYLRAELKRTLSLVFETEEADMPENPVTLTEEELLHNAVVTVAHQVYLEKYLEIIKTEKEGNNESCSVKTAEKN